ncbi:MAG TPA: ferritin-like domain-containing protein [Gammaproteobacteria bacterium]|nr:ferritin-like domain-containing protein [Gammaproteobacteria bacterium]
MTIHTGQNESIQANQVSGAVAGNYPYGKDKRYYDLLAYVVSNAMAGEIMAVDNYAEMALMFGDTDEKNDTIKQAYEEAKHIQVLHKLTRRLNIPSKKRIVEPQWLNVRKHFSEAAKRGDLAGCLAIQDLLVETMAITLYRTLTRNTDPETSRIADNILRDEIAHRQIGYDRFKGLLDEDDTAAHESLVWAHRSVISDLFSMISYKCHSLCGELEVECSTLGLDSLETDLESVRMEALEVYMETLDQCGFSPAVTTPLISELTTLAENGLSEELGSCCNVSAGCQP